jgi:hypothetical protein
VAPNKVILSFYAIVTLREAKKLLDLGGKRRRVPIGLNQGEAKNALAKAVFFNRLVKCATVTSKISAIGPAV